MLLTTFRSKQQMTLLVQFHFQKTMSFTYRLPLGNNRRDHWDCSRWNKILLMNEICNLTNYRALIYEP